MGKSTIASDDTRVAAILARIEAFQQAGKRIYLSSSFQTQSVPLLHIIGQLAQPIPVYFLNTGFLFAETHTFKRQLAAAFSLQIVELESPVPKTQQMDSEGKFFYTSDPDHCCYLNKNLPMEKPLSEFDIWISGVRRDQNANRARLNEIEESKNGVLRYHPMLDWTAKDIWGYIKKHQLPKHPLDDKGYISIGCRPCTHKFDLEEATDERAGRWSGMNKTECGLHTDLLKK